MSDFLWVPDLKAARAGAGGADCIEPWKSWTIMIVMILFGVLTIVFLILSLVYVVIFLSRIGKFESINQTLTAHKKKALEAIKKRRGKVQ